MFLAVGSGKKRRIVVAASILGQDFDRFVKEYFSHPTMIGLNGFHHVVWFQSEQGPFVSGYPTNLTHHYGTIFSTKLKGYPFRSTANGCIDNVLTDLLIICIDLRNSYGRSSVRDDINDFLILLLNFSNTDNHP